LVNASAISLSTSCSRGDSGSSGPDESSRIHSRTMVRSTALVRKASPRLTARIAFSSAESTSRLST
jgi:hypothetical protein